MTVRPDPSRDRLGDIAAACGVDPRADLYVDGRRADAVTLSGVSGIRCGSTVSARPDGGRPVASGSAHAVVRLVVVAGPAAGRAVDLPEGRHLIGRAPAATVPLDDPTIEAHHALLDVGHDGRVTVVQLTGRVPVRAGGAPVTTVRDVGRGDMLELGSSLVAVTTLAERPEPVATGGVSGDPWHVAVLRRPRRIGPSDAGAPLLLPFATEAGPVGAVGLVGSLVGLAMSVLAASLLRQPMFAVFGALGAVVSLSTWAVGRIRGSRSGRRERRAYAAAVDAFRAAVDQRARETARQHVATMATLPGALAAIGTAALWERRPDHGDAFVVSIGIGNLVRPLSLSTAGTRATASEPPGDLVAYAESAARLADMPVPLALDDPTHRAIAVVGPHRDALVRALVVQLAVQTGPADWQLVVVTGEPPRFDWAAWLPHCGPPDGTPAIFDATDPTTLAEALRRLDDGDERRLVVVADRAGLLATRTSPLRRLLDVDRAVTVVVPVADEADVPAVCSATVTTGIRARGWWRAGGWDDSIATAVHVAGLSESDAAAACRALARFADPEDPRTAASSLATEIALSALDLPMTSSHLAATWRAAGADPPPSAPVGMTADGVVEIDLDRDGPHALIAGTTGSGKSELLRTMVVALAARHSPDHLTFVLVDYKGGSTFDACSELPHTVGLVTDLDEGLAERALVSLDAEVHRRERLLRDAGAADLAAYRAAATGAPLPRLAVVIDEFAALARELPDFLAALVGIAQRGRSLGVHLILATQRPAGVVDDSIRANTNLRLALRLHDVSDAVDVVGDPAPARLPRGTPGRCVMRLGPAEVVEFQAARCTIESQSPESDACEPTQRTELELLVAEIRRAVRAEQIAAPHRPWLPPLSELQPDELGSLHPSALGVLDDPAHQSRRPLRWDRRVGNLALLGAIGSGTTTALVSIAAAAVASTPPSDVHLYVVDGRGDVALDALATLAHCGGVVRIHEAERVHRLASVLVAEIERRRGCPADARGPDVVLLVDGLMALRTWLDEPVHAEAREAFESVLRDGPVVGVAVAAVIEPGAGAGVLARFADRWVFHLDDPLDGPTFGVPSRRVPPPTPGRLVVASSGLAGQLAARRVADAVREGTDPALALAANGPVPIATLPTRVRVGDLGVPATATRLATTLPLGLAATSLEPAVVTIPDGEHVVVVGPARSGRSTALATMAAAWQAAHRDGRVTIVCPDARSPLAADRRAVASIDHLVDVPGERSSVRAPTSAQRDLVVIDDAERLDDRAGRLAQLVALGADGPTLIAAGRPDALRTSLVPWIAAVRRSRLGLVMASAAEHHADFFGGYTPLRTPIAPRPGLAWLFGDAPPTLVQIATTTPKTPELSA